MSSSDFYLRYYVGHKGKFGHEFLEFEFRPDGKFFVLNASFIDADAVIIESFSDVLLLVLVVVAETLVQRWEECAG